jgi:hypothetical protein
VTLIRRQGRQGAKQGWGYRQDVLYSQPPSHRYCRAEIALEALCHFEARERGHCPPLDCVRHWLKATSGVWGTQMEAPAVM